MGTNCPSCGTWIQRTVEGTIDHGMVDHYRVVHPGQAVPR